MAKVSIALFLFSALVTAQAGQLLQRQDTTTTEEAPATTADGASETGNDDVAISQASNLAGLCTDLADPITADIFVSCAGSVSSEISTGCNPESTDCACVVTNSVLVACIGDVCDADNAEVLTAGLGSCSGAAATATGETTLSNLPVPTPDPTGGNVENTVSDDFGAMVTPAMGALMAGVAGVVGALI